MCSQLHEVRQRETFLRKNQSADTYLQRSLQATPDFTRKSQERGRRGHNRCRERAWSTFWRSSGMTECSSSLTKALKRSSFSAFSEDLQATKLYYDERSDSEVVLNQGSLLRILASLKMSDFWVLVVQGRRWSKFSLKSLSAPAKLACNIDFTVFGRQETARALLIVADHKFVISLAFCFAGDVYQPLSQILLLWLHSQLQVSSRIMTIRYSRTCTAVVKQPMIACFTSCPSSIHPGAIIHC